MVGTGRVGPFPIAPSTWRWAARPSSRHRLLLCCRARARRLCRDAPRSSEAVARGRGRRPQLSSSVARRAVGSSRASAGRARALRGTSRLPSGPGPAMVPTTRLEGAASRRGGGGGGHRRRAPALRALDSAAPGMRACVAIRGRTWRGRPPSARAGDSPVGSTAARLPRNLCLVAHSRACRSPPLGFIHSFTSELRLRPSERTILVQSNTGSRCGTSLGLVHLAPLRERSVSRTRRTGSTFARHSARAMRSCRHAGGDRRTSC